MDGLAEDTELIRSLVDFCSLPPATVAKRAGVAASTVNRPFNGTATTRLGRAVLAKLQAAFPTYPGWPEERLSDRRLPFRGPVLERSADTVELAEFDVAYGLGASFIHDVQVAAKMRTFSRGWIRHFTLSPFEKLYWATGNGPSMTPAIQDSDILLIDTEQRTPRMWDQFWAIEMHGLGMIKTLRPGRDGSMRIISINQEFTEEVAYDGEMTVVGRVVAIVRKV